MEILRTLSTNANGDSDSDRLDNWPDKMAAEAIDLDMDCPVTVGTAGTPAAIDLKNVLAHFLGVFNLLYKLGVEQRPYQGCNGGHLRNIARLLTLREVWNDFVGVAQTVGAKVWHARVTLTPRRQKAAGRRRVVGWTQGGSIEIATKESPGLTAGALNLSRTAGANFTLRVAPRYCNGGDEYSHLPFYRETNRDALDVLGPDGKMLAVWDDNAAFGATAIGKFSLRLGEREYVRQVEPKYVDERYAQHIDAGGADITDEVTLFYGADPFADEAELPSGGALVKLITQDVATIKARFVYFPPLPETETDAIAKAAAEARKEDTAVQLPEPPGDPDYNGHQAVAPLIFRGPKDKRFAGVPGLVATRGGEVTPFVPQQLVPPGLKGNPALLRRVQKLTGLRMPGATGTRGKGIGSRREAVRSAFSHLF